MANEFYGVNRGQDVKVEQVQVGTATNGTDIELRVDLSKGLTRKDVYRLVESAILNFILDGRKTQLKP